MDYIALDILTKHLGEGTKKKDENYAFFCPFCSHYKQKLEIDLNSGKWNCWVCRTKGRSVYTLLKKIKAPSSDLSLFRNFSAPQHDDSDLFDEEKRDETLITLPEYFKPITHGTRNFDVDRINSYLNNRGVSIKDIERYKIGYITKGPKQGNIVLPSFDCEGRLNYYILKDINTNRYSNPPLSRDIIALDFFINWEEDVILVEGMFDAFAVKRNATPLLGLTLQKKLKEQIITSKTQNFFLCLDAGEIEATSEIANYISSIGKTVYRVTLPEKEDPSSLGYDKVWECINKASLYEEKDIFLENLISRW